MASAPQPIVREVMDVRQAADYLGITGDTLYRYASEGFVPAFKLGNRWRFKKDVLDAWMDRMSGIKSNGTGISILSVAHQASVSSAPANESASASESPQPAASLAGRRKPVRKAR